MITAKNYAAQAEKSLIDAIPSIDKAGYTATSFMHKRIANLISKSVHFAIPDNGNIMNDGHKGMIGIRAELPFEMITIEYFVSDPVMLSDAQIHIAKRLIIAVDSKIMNSILGTSVEDSIFVFSVMYFQNKWVLQPAGAVFPKSWESVASDGRIQFVKASPEIFDLTYGQGKQNPLTDVSSDCGSVMELLEALSCRNVSTEPIKKIKPSVNAKRITDGKLPIYETRILTINSSAIHKQTTKQSGSSHASPRQHLRRGHIRRLESGNIWVNSCVVGDPSKGSISKQYSVV